MGAGETVVIIGILALLLVSVLTALTAGISFAPWIPSSVGMAKRAFDVVAPRKGMKIADLGSGDGRILFFAYRAYGLSGTGYETSIVPYLLSLARKAFYYRAPITIHRADLFTVPLSEFDIVYIYGLPRTINEKLASKLSREMKAGAYVISYNFSIEGRKPLATFNDRWRTVFVYRF